MYIMINTSLNDYNPCTVYTVQHRRKIVSIVNFSSEERDKSLKVNYFEESHRTSSLLKLLDSYQTQAGYYLPNGGR
jgi:hypothetical protein